MATYRPTLFLSVAGIIVLFILISLAQELNRRMQLQREVQRLESEAKELKKSVIELDNLNQYFRTDDYQERLAREKLNYSNPGEKVVLIPEAKIAEEVSGEKNEAANSDSVPLKWWKIFFVTES